MACIANCGRCNYTRGPPWCCSSHCEQVDIEVLGYCQDPKALPALDPCDDASQTVTIIIFLVGIISAIALFGAILYVWRRKLRLIGHNSGTVNLDGLNSAEIQFFVDGSISPNRKAYSEKTPLTGQEYQSGQHEMSGRLLDNLVIDQQMALDMVEEKPYEKKYEIPENGFKLDQNGILGSGAFGVVYKGHLWGQMVAVKTVKPFADKAYLKSLLSELKVLIHLGQHENIVSLLGAFTSQLKSGVVYVFLEYCEMGDLLTYLRRNNNSQTSQQNLSDRQNPFQHMQGLLTKDNFLLWSIQIANGLRFLSDKKVIHGDVAARNALLKSKDLVKLTDFGLSRRLYEYTNYVKHKQEPLPWRWMSLESLRQMKFSTQSDVWSFACLLYEIYTLGDVPYTGRNWSQEFVYELMDGLRLNKPKECDEEIYELMTKCWDNDPTQRPTFAEIHKKLLAFRDSEYTKI